MENPRESPALKMRPDVVATSEAGNDWRSAVLWMNLHSVISQDASADIIALPAII
jgi:hypothetical protein